MFKYIIMHNSEQQTIISKVVNAAKNLLNIQKKVKIKQPMIESKVEALTNYWEQLLEIIRQKAIEETQEAEEGDEIKVNDLV